MAEELLGTKAYYVREGRLRDVDIALFAHVGDAMNVNWGDGMTTGSSRSVHVQGRERPRRRCTVARQVGPRRCGPHGHRLAVPPRAPAPAAALALVYSDGGDQPNVVPPTAAIWYFRETDYAHIKELWQIADDMAKGATLMTNTEVTSRVLGSAWPSHMNKTVAETMHANMEIVGMPTWSEADQTLARALQREVKVPEIGLRTKINDLRGREEIPDDEKRGGGSDDIGDVLVERPDRHTELPANIAAGPGHNWANAVSMATPIAHWGHDRRCEGAGAHGARPVDAARAGRAGVGLLQQRPDEGQKYVPLLRPEDKPAIWLNKETMDKLPAGDEEALLFRSDEVPRPISSSSVSSTRRSGRTRPRTEGIAEG